MQTIHGVQPLHSYRAYLMPPTINPADVEQLADAGKLPAIRLRAANADQATTGARYVTGAPVHSVERVEG